ncbi:DUF4339 domain-containing protein [Chitiniphilus shinanonensis]|uniref:DUF4339 domain-containing protein n=1 Tax=Chitiniphilus shinanonensis TaxID=553088 RepID=UPI00305DF613
MTTSTPSVERPSWFYELKGQRIGPVPESALIPLIQNGTLGHDTAVWRQGFSGWQALAQTELHAYLDQNTPPPLTGHQVNNTLVWVLAFAPLIGLILEYFIAGMVHRSEYRVERAVSEGEFWYITLLLNIALSLWDERRLKQAGVSTARFRGWVWLVPVYLFQRAKALQQNLAYFIVWLVCFALILAA